MLIYNKKEYRTKYSFHKSYYISGMYIFIIKVLAHRDVSAIINLTFAYKRCVGRYRKCEFNIRVSV